MTVEQQFDLKINGEVHSVRADGATTLLSVLRDQLGLTGAKCGCNQGLCGACNVLMDDQAVRSCLIVAGTCTDRKIETIEGLEENGELSPVQQAFLDAGAVQCGYCMPGMCCRQRHWCGKTRRRMSRKSVTPFPGTSVDVRGT